MKIDFTMFGELLKDKIDNSGLSKSSIAKSVGVSSPTITNWVESGIVPSDMIYSLSKVLKCDLFLEASKIVNTSEKIFEVTTENDNNKKPSLYRELELQQKIIDTLEKRQADLEERIGELKKRLGD